MNDTASPLTRVSLKPSRGRHLPPWRHRASKGQPWRPPSRQTRISSLRSPPPSWVRGEAGTRLTGAAIPRNDAGLRVLFRPQRSHWRERAASGGRPDGRERPLHASLPIHHTDRRSALQDLPPGAPPQPWTAAPHRSSRRLRRDRRARRAQRHPRAPGRSRIPSAPFRTIQEGKPGCERGRGGERNGASLVSCQSGRAAAELVSTKAAMRSPSSLRSSGSVSNRYLSR